MAEVTYSWLSWHGSVPGEEHHTSSSSSSSALPHLLGTKLDRRHLSFISGSVYLNSFIISGLRYDFTSRAESLKVSRVTTSPVTAHFYIIMLLFIYVFTVTGRHLLSPASNTQQVKRSLIRILQIFWLTEMTEYEQVCQLCLFPSPAPSQCRCSGAWLPTAPELHHSHQQHYMTLLSTSPWLPIVPSLPVTLQRTFLVTRLMFFCCAACYVPVARRDHLNKLK